MAKMDRRRALGLVGVGAAAGAVVAGSAVAGAGQLAQPDQPAGLDLTAAVDLWGEHQPGIVTPAQDRLHFVAFDVITKDRAELIDLLQQWTTAAERMMAGQHAGPGGAVDGPYHAAPEDTGEAIGLPAAGLTLTIGFGPSLFADRQGQDRFGLAARRPSALVDLPKFPLDAIRPEISGGDLCVQACAHDPQVAVHAVRNLARIGFGKVTVRWSQVGFGRTSSTSLSQGTARNLMGFKDGTANLKAEEPAELVKHLWVQPGDGPDWLVGGSYLVTRKIRMAVETWDRTTLAEQEVIFGRTKGEGAPLTGQREFDKPDFAAKGTDGEFVIADVAHVRLAHPDQNQGVRLLRRGYNYVDGSDGLGRLDAGLFFISYQRNPLTQFVPVQANLARSDVLNEYIRHISSGVFACPPGVGSPDDFWGRALFE